MVKKDLTGMTFGQLTVIKMSDERLYNEIAWVCRCKCENITIATTGQLLRGTKISCGCLKHKTPPNALDLAGKKFGKLTVIERAGTTKNGTVIWLCRCKCGNVVNANGTTLRRGEMTSCGCDKKERIQKARKTLMIDKTIDGVQIPLITKKVRKDSRTGHKGVTIRNRRGKEYYEANITVKGKRKYLGIFNTIDDAVDARRQAEIDYYEPLIKKLEEKENESRRNKKLD